MLSFELDTVNCSFHLDVVEQVKFSQDRTSSNDFHCPSGLKRTETTSLSISRVTAFLRS